MRNVLLLLFSEKDMANNMWTEYCIVKDKEYLVVMQQFEKQAKEREKMVFE